MAMNANKVRTFMTEFAWVHQVIGLVGGLTFFVGSIFFLYKEPLQLVGIWLFIVGSFAMFVGSAGSFFLKYERHELNI